MSRDKGQEDAEKLLEAVNEAARRAQGAWFFFLGVSAFLFITVSSVTHATLLLDAPVRLPLFQVQMHAYAFFYVAPILYILMHWGILVQHRILRDKLQALEDTLKDEDGKHPLRQRLSIYAFAQHLAGPARRGGFALAVSLIAFLSLSVMPLVLLAYFQASFLPWHSETVTWANRLTLAADAVAIFLAGLFATNAKRRLLKNGAARLFSKNAWRSLPATVGRVLRRMPAGIFRLARNMTPYRFVAALEKGIAVVAIFFAFMVMTVTGGTLDRAVCAGWLDRLWCTNVPVVKKEAGANTGSQQRQAGLFIGPAYGWGSSGWGADPGEGCGCSHSRRAFFLTAWLFERGVDRVSGRSNGWLGLGRNLVVTNLDLNALSGSVRPSLRGRDLSWGEFSHIVLHNADLTGANLTHAKFDGADLTGARFGCADTGWEQVKQWRSTSGEVFEYNQRKQKCSNLLHASFGDARLYGAIFIGGKDGNWERLIKDNSKEAGEFAPVSFDTADLAGAHFRNVDITGWSFGRLVGASFEKVQASFADYSSADLRGARFVDTDLTAADFTGARLEGAQIKPDSLAYAAFVNVRLWYTRLELVETLENDALAYMLRHAAIDDLRIMPLSKDEKTALRKRLDELPNALRERLENRLAPLFTDSDWQDEQRKRWELLTGSVVGCVNDCSKVLNAYLQRARLRAKALAIEFCGNEPEEAEEKQKWKENKERAISLVKSAVIYKLPLIADGEADGVAQDDKPADEGTESEALNDPVLAQHIRQLRTQGILPKKEPEEIISGPDIANLFDPEVLKKHCPSAKVSEKDIKLYKNWVGNLQKSLSRKQQVNKD